MTDLSLPFGNNGNMLVANLLTPFNNAVDGTTLVVTNGVMSATGAQNGSVIRNIVILTSGSSYAATDTDYIIVFNKDTGSATAVTLPASPVSGRMVVVKDGKGDAATNPITVTAAAGNIDGNVNVILNNNYASVELAYAGSQWVIT